jgi:hypothetical protein
VTTQEPTKKMIVTIDDDHFELGDLADAGALRERIERAVADGGRFVDVPVVGSDPIAVLITPRTRVTLRVARDIAPDPLPPSYPTGLHALDEI